MEAPSAGRRVGKIKPALAIRPRRRVRFLAGPSPGTDQGQGLIRPRMTAQFQAAADVAFPFEFDAKFVSELTRAPLRVSTLVLDDQTVSLEIGIDEETTVRVRVGGLAPLNLSTDECSQPHLRSRHKLTVSDHRAPEATVSVGRDESRWRRG